MTRKTKFYPNDPRDLPGDNFAFVRKALTQTIYHVVSEPALVAQPNALAAMLGLTPEQAESFKGTNRLNFWRNGCLNVQIEHGYRATKIKLPSAVVTDAQLDDFFAAWGWQKLGNKPYYKPTATSLVRI
ncbi:MAG: hypothetical protein KJ077_27630 [Anaerolineae bacterium]|nr:hypothetical protein [Anaerolineae bacterium]